jgi:hypothetical protein
MRRLPPAKVEQNLSGLLNLLPDDQEELLQRIDQPLEVETDADVRNFASSDTLFTIRETCLLSLPADGI